MSPDHPSSTLHVKVEYDQSTAQRGPSCRQQRDATVSPQLVKGEGPEEPPSHLYGVPSAEQTAGVKAEPGGEEAGASPSTGEAEVPFRGNPESAGLQGEILRGEERSGYGDVQQRRAKAETDKFQIKSVFIDIAQMNNQNQFTICTEKGVLCPWPHGRSLRQHQRDIACLSVTSPGTDRHAIDVACTEKNNKIIVYKLHCQNI